MRHTFVFFHVGNDVSTPTMLVESIRWTNPNARIIFCTDVYTPDIEQVDERIEVEGNRSQLMTYRLKAFADCGADEPAIYLDTDMLVIRAIDPATLLDGREIAMCRRSFNVADPFNGNFRNLDFREYDQKPIGEVYPYVACCTVTDNSAIWKTLLDLLLTLNPKFHLWYGDQEALKRFAATRLDRVKDLPESIFGCLPEERKHLPGAAIVHFKGASRKSIMSSFHSQMRAQVGTGNR